MKILFGVVVIAGVGAFVGKLWIDRRMESFAATQQRVIEEDLENQRRIERIIERSRRESGSD